MSHPDVTREYGENETSRLVLMQEVVTPEGYVGRIVGYGDGRLNIKVGFSSGKLQWYKRNELKAI